ncbi:MAG: HesA/MoeB/ThiF family protein [Xanthomonadales bacterium]|nr:HesA/MoeB/ThiF family protein [Xanthomonadales bacterium]
MKADNRYAAHEALPAIGTEGQDRISASHVAVIGLGGLGCPATLYLAAGGIGRLTLCDFDRVAESNLSRQLLYGPDDVGQFKVDIAARSLLRLRPDLEIEREKQRVGAVEAQELAAGADLVLDASDNFATRLHVNKACLQQRTPWVMGAAVRTEGQLMTFRPDLPDRPCYRCVYGDAPDQLEDCAGAGIFGPVTGIIGSAMAAHALTLLAGGDPGNRFMALDAATWEWQGLKSRRKPDCEDCSNG